MFAFFSSYLLRRHLRRWHVCKSRSRVLYSLNARPSSPDSAAAFPVPYFRLPRCTLHHPPAIYRSTEAPILLRRCICREHAHAEASESRYIRLRARAWQAQAWRTESRYYERRIRVSAARPPVDRPIYRCSRARRIGERRPKLADRVATSRELMGWPRSVVRERD